MQGEPSLSQNFVTGPVLYPVDVIFYLDQSDGQNVSLVGAHPVRESETCFVTRSSTGLLRLIRDVLQSQRSDSLLHSPTFFKLLHNCCFHPVTLTGRSLLENAPS